ncbi:MAG TPA: molecular chaperone DnaK [Methylococcaceae bacterium]|nr:molecular chaperone DnaK [Methylococcaceae bacterium]
MKIKNPQYFVGIDLGTTHTVVAYAPISAPQSITLFHIEQLVDVGQVAARPLLPSVRYHPAEGEVALNSLAFTASDQAILGEAARVLGAKTKGRFVTSAKSWLSHPFVDQCAAILPWGSSDDVAKVSPLEASASYLAHIRAVWRHQFPDAPLEHQEVVITVPASFDEGARSLTVEAAKMAGLSSIRLLEEPQAVCYDWLRANAAQLSEKLASVRLLLVCDVGGGTTDLTLISVKPGEGDKEPTLTRIGVGDHLMLGGDNVDLALAHTVEARLIAQDATQKRLSVAELSQLLEQCRQAKERLLADDAPESVKITLLASGAKLLGGTRATTLTREEVRTIALDGFFPLSARDEVPDKKRSGVVEFGLPYASEPAVSKHIAAFLKLHAHAAAQALGNTKEAIVPDALLLNGGVFRSQPVTQRAVALLASWRDTPPILLENQHPELAVAFGAVSYAAARREKKLKIGGGAARSYFLLIETTQETAMQKGICILPRGSEEEEEIILKNHRFALRLGVPVRFHLASTIGDTRYQPGDMADITDDFHSLPPLAVAFNSDSTQEVIVELAVMQTDVGTLKIQCVGVENRASRWDVEFQLRRGVQHSLTSEGLPANLPALCEKISDVFGAKSKQIDPKAVKNLRTDLEKMTGMARNAWSSPLLRALFVTLLEGEKYRRRSEAHEKVWLNLVGYCLRPGFGYPLDDWRVEQLWKMYPHGIQFVNETALWAEWWTLWRRIAGGLSPQAQERIFADIAKYIDPSAARQVGVAKQIKTRSYDDIIRLAAVLERLPLQQKIQLGEWLLKRLEKASESVQTWWALGRIGGRMPFHGSSHNVVPASTVERWLVQMLTEDWKKTPQIGFAATLMARMSGDRARDIHAPMREQVIEKLKISKAPLSWIEMVEDVTVLSEKDEKQLLGEALPSGLKLVSIEEK